MSSLLKKKDDCTCFRDQLEECADRLPGPLSAEQLLSVLPSSAREHSLRCDGCQSAVQDLVTARTLLHALPSFSAAHSVSDAPWFAPRVMTAISAQEASARTGNVWTTAVPRFVSRLAWASALLIIVATTWLYEQARTAPLQTASNSSESSLFDAPAYAPHDDVLTNADSGSTDREQP